jgi:hypothetical protein
MKKVLLAAAALACFGGTALAGVNANGSLIVALADGVVYTNEIDDYCGATGLQACDGAITRTDDTTPVVLGILGAFPSSANPRVSGVTFGWTYDDANITLVATGYCGDFELATGGWPGSGEGTAVTWGSAQTSHLLDIYWAAAYDYYGNASTLDLGMHPSQGADFADDSIPSVLDPIAAFGSFGFSTDGNVPCPPDVRVGACCFSDGSCQVLDADGCDAAGGDYRGDDTVCDPNPCMAATGACCIDGVCSVLSQTDCESAGGDYQGDNVPCESDTCPVPVVDTTWGQIKGIYR